MTLSNITHLESKYLAPRDTFAIDATKNSNFYVIDSTDVATYTMVVPSQGANRTLGIISDFLRYTEGVSNPTQRTIKLVGAEQELQWFTCDINLESAALSQFFSFSESAELQRPSNFLRSDSLKTPDPLVLNLGERRVTPESSPSFSVTFTGEHVQIIKNPTQPESVIANIVFPKHVRLIVFSPSDE